MLGDGGAETPSDAEEGSEMCLPDMVVPAEDEGYSLACDGTAVDLSYNEGLQAFVLTNLHTHESLQLLGDGWALDSTAEGFAFVWKEDESDPGAEEGIISEVCSDIFRLCVASRAMPSGVMEDWVLEADSEGVRRLWGSLDEYRSSHKVREIYCEVGDVAATVTFHAAYYVMARTGFHWLWRLQDLYDVAKLSMADRHGGWKWVQDRFKSWYNAMADRGRPGYWIFRQPFLSLTT